VPHRRGGGADPQDPVGGRDREGDPVREGGSPGMARAWPARPCPTAASDSRLCRNW
jgi:hypothetical protein